MSDPSSERWNAAGLAWLHESLDEIRIGSITLVFFSQLRNSFTFLLHQVIKSVRKIIKRKYDLALKIRPSLQSTSLLVTCNGLIFLKFDLLFVNFFGLKYAYNIFPKWVTSIMRISPFLLCSISLITYSNSILFLLLCNPHCTNYSTRNFSSRNPTQPN